MLAALALPARAVTLADTESLAASTPGTSIARVFTTAEAHPDLPGIPAPGVISVMILPYLPKERPEPTRGLLRLVARRLDPLRVPGSRFEVTGPLYREVVAQVSVRTDSRERPADVASRVVAAIRAFLHPLTGGPDERGWPIGRDVYRTELLQAIVASPGVISVSALSLAIDGGDPICGDLCLGPRGLPASGAHVVRVELADPRIPSNSSRPC